ncbi:MULTISPECIES: sensor histidine kinase [Sphingobium]|jgi:two-component sensor histidine kinase|uniref:Sensor histidine kinase n=1 Tax=Sphingobium yanoikuyae TaxID=13690 RepID=A0A0J9CY94_SPHYA|nr:MULTISPECIES: histidine kinase [Sphingobium]ATP20355.1 sensor histidine kinase [Sphingobium yanoikuyae]KMW29992.1 histidine kinase [Sphingobium yanoikuyae]TKV40655.1 histidine kinase [Sphingobium sp. MP9-4]
MTLPTEDGPRGVAPAVALYSIIGFWFFYAVLISLRAAVVGFDSQIEMAARRAVVTLIGIIVTWVLYLVLRRFDGKPLMIRVVAAFSLAAPFALAMAAANFYVFNIYDPVSMFPDADHEKYTQQGYALTAILEDALSRYFFLAAWAGLYLALSYASEAHRTERRAARLERAAQQAELRSLRYQVNPHFLFNTLNSLSSLVMKDRRDEAEHMIMSLSNFYRTSLTGDPLDDVQLEEEVHLQKLYLDIEAVRFPDRLATRIDIPADLLTACVPGLILQPLVENAIKYGVSRTSSPVAITIRAREEHGLLHLTVADNGDKPPSPGDGGSGIGLANVRDRLSARFGDQGRIDYGPQADGGFAVNLFLPLNRRGC